MLIYRPEGYCRPHFAAISTASNYASLWLLKEKMEAQHQGICRKFHRHSEGMLAII